MGPPARARGPGARRGELRLRRDPVQHDAGAVRAGHAHRRAGAVLPRLRLGPVPGGRLRARACDDDARVVLFVFECVKMF